MLANICYINYLLFTQDLKANILIPLSGIRMHHLATGFDAPALWPPIETVLEWSEVPKRLVWAVCCICWNGSFRIHEILSKKKKEFDPLCTLLDKDVKLQQFEVQG